MKRDSLIQISLFFKKTKFTLLESIFVLKHQTYKIQYFFGQNYWKFNLAKRVRYNF